MQKHKTLSTKFCWTKFWPDKIFHQNKFSTLSWNFDNFVRFSPDFCIEILDKIFDTKPKFLQFCPIFAWLLYWNIGQNFRRTKFFVGQNFRHQAEISTILSDEFLSDKVYFFQNIIICRGNVCGTLHKAASIIQFALRLSIFCIVIILMWSAAIK